MSKLTAHLALLFLTAGLSIGQAAFIVVDDSDPDSITITAGDFEEGFFVDGNLLTIGLGDSNSVTFSDGGFSISGSWIDLGLATGSVDVLFALAGDPTGVTSGIEFDMSTDGSLGTLSGSFGGFTGLTYFITGLPTFPQNGVTQVGAGPFLSVSFTPENVEGVPEPSTMLLMAGALPLLYALRRRKA